VAGLGYWAVGAKLVFLLILLTTVFALVPFVGAMTVWLPVSAWIAFVEQRYLAGAMLAVWGLAVVSMADNIIKPFVLHGQSNLHPLLALLSVLGGVQALGAVGILVGPMVVVFLQALLSILQRETEGELRHEPHVSPPTPLPLILSLRLRGLRLIYAPPRKVVARSLKERRE
jgi:predicted PurR-regulated permease PerM